MSTEIHAEFESNNIESDNVATTTEIGESLIQKGFWSTVLGYVGVTSAIYTLAVASHIAVVMIAFFPQGTLGALFIFAASTIYLSVPVMMVAFIVGTCCIGVTHIVLVSLNIEYEKLYIGGAVGGLIAFVCSLLLFGVVILSSPDEISISIQHLIVFYFTLIATLMGQVAGVKGAREARFSSGHCPSNYSMPSIPKFQIRHMLLITLWCAVLLTVLRLLGLFAIQLGVFSLAWLIAQYFTLSKVLQVLERKAAARVATQACST